MGNVMGKAYTYKKTIKRAACAMLAAGLVFTGCPEILKQTCVVQVRAASEWQSGIKKEIDNITKSFSRDENRMYGRNITSLGIGSDEFDTVNVYMTELLKLEDYYWLKRLQIGTQGDYTYIWYTVKSEYVNDDWSINKEQAKADYITLQDRLNKGEWKEVLTEMIDKKSNSVNNSYINLGITQLNITMDMKNELESYLYTLQYDNENYYWVNEFYPSYVQTDTQIKSIFIYIKSEYQNKDYSINKEQAKLDYNSLQSRLEKGEQLQIIKERLEYNTINNLNKGFYVYLADLKIPESSKNEIDNYAEMLRDGNPQYWWVTSFISAAKEGKMYYFYFAADEKFLNKSGKRDNDLIIKDYLTFKGRISSLTGQIQSDMTDLEKMLAIYNWEMRECEYDFYNYMAQTVPAVSFTKFGVVNGKAVCAGYANFMKYMLNIYGIKNFYASSSKMSHQWNVVYLNGNYYHLDATWDDRGSDDYNEGVYGLRYFIKSDDEFLSLRHHDWSGAPECNKTFNLEGTLLNNIKAEKFSYYDGYWYYIYNEDRVCMAKLDGSEESTIKVFDESILNMFTYKNYMYVATPKKVYKINLDNLSQQEIIFNTDNEDNFGEITEFVIKQGKIKIDGSTSTKIIDIQSQSTLELTDKTCAINTGDTKNILLLYKSDLGNKPEWLSSNPDIISVDDNGNVTAKTDGIATIYAGLDGKIVTCTVTADTQNGCTYGDANGDGKIDSRDAVLIKKYVAGFTGFIIDLEASDVNADGKVDTRDAVKILKKIAGFDVTLGAA